MKKWLICLLCIALLFSVTAVAETATEGTMPQEGLPFGRGQRPGRGEMQPPEGFEPPQLQDGAETPQLPDGEQVPQQETEPPQELPQQEGEPMQRPDRMQENTATESAPQTTEGEIDYLTLGISLALLAGAFVFVIFYRRKTY